MYFKCSFWWAFSLKEPYSKSFSKGEGTLYDVSNYQHHLGLASYTFGLKVGYSYIFRPLPSAGSTLNFTSSLIDFVAAGLTGGSDSLVGGEGPLSIIPLTLFSCHTGSSQVFLQVPHICD